MTSSNLFLYWHDSDNIPEYIDLCKDTILFHNLKTFNIHFVNDKNMHEYIDAEDITVSNSIKSIPKKSDFIRIALLKKHGGLWLDIDCICLRPLTEITNIVSEYDYVGYGNIDSFVSNACIATKSNSPIINEIYSILLTKIEDGNYKRWNELGSITVTEICKRYTNKTFIYESSYFAPIPYDEYKNFFKDLSANTISSKSYTAMLFNSTFLRTNIHKMTKHEILNKPWLISNLIKSNTTHFKN